jgi:predicted lipoprotein
LQSDAVFVKRNLVQEPSSVRTKPSREGVRRAAGLVVFILIAGTLAIEPPFVIKHLPGRMTPDANSGQVLSQVTRVVDLVWATKVVPTVLDKAYDIGAILPDIRANPESAGEKYGRRDASNPFNYMVKGTGKVVDINTRSMAGTLNRCGHFFWRRRRDSDV